MKKLNIFYVVLLAAVSFTACKKEEDEGKLPNIAFVSGTGLLSADAIIAKDSTVMVSIKASKAEDADVLKSYTTTRSVDGGSDSTLSTETLSGASGDSITRAAAIHTRNVAGTEKYTFTVVNRDGLKNSVSLTITVN